MSVFRMTLVGIVAISSMVNILALTSPLFMLQVYDRVLSSRSESTLVALIGLVAALLAFQAVLDIIRSRVLLRIGERFDQRVSGQIHRAVVLGPLRSRSSGDGLQPLRDLDSVRSFLASPGPTAFFDMPWIPFYLVICFAFHFWLGVTALTGAVILIAFAVSSGLLSWRPSREATQHGGQRNRLAEAGRRNAEAVQAMGFQGNLEAEWQRANAAFLSANRRAADTISGWGGTSKAIRFMLQSAILAVGAYLVIQGQVTAGVMIASSIMMGRALAPIDTAIASWKSALVARQSWVRLKKTLASLEDEEKEVTPLPAPQGNLAVVAVSIVPPGQNASAVVTDVSFTIQAGSALGIIGPSGSGKTSLARALVGVWPPARGKVRLDGAALDQWDIAALGCHIGYLPQDVELFEGTIAQNIARFDPEPDSAKIIEAARAANVHDLIVHLPDGYDTELGEHGATFSAGQRQRVALARALYGDPFLVVLDEPNANLDSDGEAAVIAAIAGVRKRGGIVIVIAHRPSALSSSDLVLVMDKGRMRDFGPRDEVLQRVLAPHAQGKGPSDPIPMHRTRQTKGAGGNAGKDNTEIDGSQIENGAVKIHAS